MNELIRLIPSGDVYAKQGDRICGPLADEDWQTNYGALNKNHVEDAVWNFDEEWSEQEYAIIHTW